MFECVINFSEGRRLHVVEKIVSAISEVPQIAVLGKHVDPAHNRSVVTFVGPPPPVEEAALGATSIAAELIDLTRHQGAHPRLGATDVIPFVPLSGVTMQECVDSARHVGQRIASELGIPVFLYEEAALRPDRRNLADIRKGEFELLRDEISRNDLRIPDFGERKVHPTAGATIVGAREILIAYNIYLATDDLTIAKGIARAVRFRDGGLPFVKALGFYIPERRQTQVSMNLTNYRKTSMRAAFERVREEAERRNVPIVSSEIVGLVPQDALFDGASDYLKIENFTPNLILENAIQVFSFKGQEYK